MPAIRYRGTSERARPQVAARSRITPSGRQRAARKAYWRPGIGEIWSAGHIWAGATGPIDGICTLPNGVGPRIVGVWNGALRPPNRRPHPPEVVTSAHCDGSGWVRPTRMALRGGICAVRLVAFACCRRCGEMTGGFDQPTRLAATRRRLAAGAMASKEVRPARQQCYLAVPRTLKPRHSCSSHLFELRSSNIGSSRLAGPT